MNLAFISYSHHDAKIAEWLQKGLEHYRISKNSGFANPVDPTRKHLRPIFRDRTDLAAGRLYDLINQNLENSMFLLLICSRRAAKSEWVNKEVQYFIEHDRYDQIIPIVVDGIPFSGSSRECVPPVLLDYTRENPDKELLCIDLTAEGEFRTLMAVVARILGVPFDMVYDRQLRHRRKNIITTVSALSVVSLIALYMLTPIENRVRLSDVYGHLPHVHGGELVVNNIHYPLDVANYDTVITLPSTPGYKRGSQLELTFSAPFYDSIRTTIPVGFGFKSEAVVSLSRDDTFALFAGRVITEEGNPICGALVKVTSETAVTDEDGFFRIYLPLERQAEEQTILIMCDGYQEVYREDECPSDDLTYIMHPSED
ncbi:MAG: TIR domain-containing protein [Bacteroidales bacterium]|nr:TIR domain-containing protein [Bacteroidales bacterium]